MRIFNNPKDRKGLENNERKVHEIAPVINETKTQHDRVESESTGSAVTEAEQTAEEAQTTSKKTWKKKADTTV